MSRTARAYSVLSAFTGCTRVARRAGSHDARRRRGEQHGGRRDERHRIEGAHAVDQARDPLGRDQRQQRTRSQPDRGHPQPFAHDEADDVACAAHRWPCGSRFRGYAATPGRHGPRRAPCPRAPAPARRSVVKSPAPARTSHSAMLASRCSSSVRAVRIGSCRSTACSSRRTVPSMACAASRPPARTRTWSVIGVW